MKILFLADNFAPEKNAQASRVYERACFWAKWGHQVTVITCAPNFPEGKVYEGYRNRWHFTEEISGIRVVRVKTFIAANSGTLRRTLDYCSFAPASVLAGLFEEKPDVVVATSPHLLAAVAGWALAALRDLPFVMELSDLWPESIAAVGAFKKGLALRAIEKLELFLYRKAARIVALTSSFRTNLVSRGVPEEKISVVINGVDLSKYAPLPKDDSLAAQHGLSGAFVVGYLGTLGMAHALSNVLEAAERVKDPRVRFLLVGPGAEREKLMRAAAEKKLSNVVFLPPQPKERMRALWSLCDVALVHLKNTPLFRMVIPSKIFEAMGMGLPILMACPPGEGSQIVEREGAGLCVTPEDPAALADAAERMCRDKSLLAGMAQASLAAAPRYTRERQARDFLAALELGVKTGSPSYAAAGIQANELGNARG